MVYFNLIWSLMQPKRFRSLKMSFKVKVLLYWSITLRYQMDGWGGEMLYRSPLYLSPLVFFCLDAFKKTDVC